MPRMQPIARAPGLATEIARQVIAAIHEGTYAPGAKLPTERELSEAFGVSRIVVREALSQLKFDGLIETRQGLGAFVSAAGERRSFRLAPAGGGAAELRHVFQLRIAVESEAAALAARFARRPQLSAIGLALESLAADIDAGRDGISSDACFHTEFAKATGNPYFERLLAMLGGNLRAAIAQTRLNTARRLPGRIAAVQAEHKAIADALQAGDGEAARRAMRCHLIAAMQRLGLEPGPSPSQR